VTEPEPPAPFDSSVATRRGDDGTTGLLFGGDLPGQKARIKLMVALGVTSDQAVLRRLFEAA